MIKVIQIARLVLVIKPDQWIYALSLNGGINFKYIAFLKTMSLVLQLSAPNTLTIFQDPLFLLRCWVEMSLKSFIYQFISNSLVLLNKEGNKKTEQRLLTDNRINFSLSQNSISLFRFPKIYDVYWIDPFWGCKK